MMEIPKGERIRALRDAITKCEKWLANDMKMSVGLATKRIEALMELCATAHFHEDLEYIRSEVAEVNSAIEWCKHGFLAAEDIIAQLDIGELNKDEEV